MASAPRKKYLSSLGMGESTLPIVSICPALDLIQSRAPDAPHSDFQGLTRLMQELLVTVILTKPGSVAYTHEFQQFPMKPGWNRLQSPLHYIFSWSLSEAGRASFHTAMVLRSKLKPAWVKPKFLDAVKTVFKIEMEQQQLTPVEVIAWCYARMAHSNAVVGSPLLSSSDRANFNAIVMLGRSIMQGLWKCADRSIMKLQHGLSSHKKLHPSASSRITNSARSQSTSHHHQNPSNPINIASESDMSAQEHSLLGTSIIDIALRQKWDGEALTAKYTNIQGLPNMHQACHFE